MPSATEVSTSKRNNYPRLQQAGGLCAVLAVALSAVCPAAGAVTAPQVDKAVKAGVNYLYRSQRKDGTWQTKYAAQHPGGVEALVVLAALSAGRPAEDPQLKVALKVLDKTQPQTTYVRALRAMVYARLGKDYRQRLDKDVAWLREQVSRRGGWGYGPGHPTTRHRRGWTDTSNSQLATLALRDAAAAGAKTPEAYWRRCRTYWSMMQNRDGGWGYTSAGVSGVSLRSGSYGTMTAGGLASSFYIVDQLTRYRPPARAKAKRRANLLPLADRKQLARAVGWLQKNYTVRRIPKWGWGLSEYWHSFYLYCLARAAGEAGRAKLAGKDWYTESTEVLVSRQRRDGSWPDPAGGGGSVIRTCFALLALTEGRKAFIVSRLTTDDEFGLDCRDMANATRWCRRRCGWPVTWKQITPKDDEQAFAAAPILYICGRGKSPIDKELGEKIRRFVRNGGTVLVQAFGGDAEFAGATRKALEELLPEYRPAALGSKHPVFGAKFEISPVEAVGLSNGCRTAAFVLTSDLSGPWHGDDEKYDAAFRFFANLAVYATDGHVPRERLAGRVAPAAVPKAVRWVSVARLTHSGDWNACPLAMARLSEVLSAAVSVAVKQAKPVDLNNRVPRSVRLLWVTGSDALKLSDAQLANLKGYVNSGGTVWMDSAAGRGEFFISARKLLHKAFGEQSLSLVPSPHPLLTGRFGGGVGARVVPLRYNRHVAAAGKGPGPQLWAIKADGRLAVILSPYGVTCPLEGNPAYGCLGLRTPDARRLAANVVLYAAWRGRGLMGR